MLAGYRVEDIIGTGGMGIVYRAEQVALRRRVALKVLSPALSRDVSYRERFRREGAHAAALHHPNVVPVFDSGEVDGVLYLAMMLVEGRSLADVLANGPISLADAVATLKPIAAALDAAHAIGIVHRDVKPQNVLVDVHGTPLLADFGVAKALASTTNLTATTDFVGTVNYSAPEQMRGGQVTPSVDVYSLAAVLFACLTGAPPFQRDSEAAVLQAHLSDPPPSLGAGRNRGGELDRILQSGLAKSPEDRPQSAGALIAAASGLLKPGEVPAGLWAPSSDTTGPGSAGTAPTWPAVESHESHSTSVTQPVAPPSMPAPPTQADRKRADVVTTASATSPSRSRLPWALAAAAVVVVVAAAAVALIAKHHGSPARRHAISATVSRKRAKGETAQVSQRTTSSSSSTNTSSRTSTAPAATAAHVERLETQSPADGSYSILVPAGWRYFAESSPEGTTTDVWLGAEPSDELRVMLSNCSSCAEDEGQPSAGSIQLPAGTQGSFEINKLSTGFEARTAGNPNPDNGLIVVTRSGTAVTGYAQVDLWLPASLHGTATQMLDSFSPLKEAAE